MDWRKQFNVPNTLTIIRLAAIPLMAHEILTMEGASTEAFILFVFIWVTDALDGYIARKYNLVTKLGTVLDPLADKLFQITTAYCLYKIGLLPMWVPLFLFIKDCFLILGGGRLFKEGVVVPARMSGKIATFLLAVGFGIILIFPEDYHHIASYFIYGSIISGVIAFASYALSFLRKIRNKRQGEKEVKDEDVEYEDEAQDKKLD